MNHLMVVITLPTNEVYYVSFNIYVMLKRLISFHLININDPAMFYDQKCFIHVDY